MPAYFLRLGLEGTFVNPKRILVALTLALFASGLCTWLASRKLAAHSTVQIAPVARYAAPSRALEAGEVLNPDNTELLAWPGATPVDGAFTRIADLNGRAVLYPLAKGQPILDRDISVAGSGIGLASRIPDGMRAVALRSDEVVGVAGFLVPGSRVDVLVTCRADNSADPLTTTVLQNAVVLAVGHQAEPDPEGKPSDVTVVTLLLTPEESQRAVLAGTQGAIHLVLRNGGDNGSSDNPPTLFSQLAGGQAAMQHAPVRWAAAAAPAVPETPKHHEVEIVLGGGSGEARGSGQ
jgi:pilus assembly protein CpaB